jgi:hypothetical protein
MEVFASRIRIDRAGSRHAAAACRDAWRGASESLPLLSERSWSLSTRWPCAQCVISLLRGRQRRVVDVIVAAIECANAGAIALAAGVRGKWRRMGRLRWFVTHGGDCAG